jgi:hypothetical protein
MSTFDLLDLTRAPRAHLGEVTSSESGLTVRLASATADATLLQCDVLESALREQPFVAGDIVLVLELAGTDDRGVVLGRVRPAPAAALSEPREDRPPREAPADNPDTLILEAKSSLVLRVGDGSIEMRADGKILIKGTDLVSHAKRMNRIKGGAVSIN